MELGVYLKKVRKMKNLTLRGVEKMCCGKISNAYLSQIENGHVKKPSPNILFLLAEIYGDNYERLMDLSGYTSCRGSEELKPTPNIFMNLSKEDEEKLIEYMNFLNFKKCLIKKEVQNEQ